MNTKGIKFLAVLAVLAMAFAAFAVVSDSQDNDADPVYVAQIGTEKYETLAAAFAAVTSSGATIEILKEFSEELSAGYTTVGDITLDLKGFNVTLTGGKSITVGANKSLKITDSTRTAAPESANLTMTGYANGTVGVIDVEAGATVAMKYINMSTTGTAFYPHGDASSVTIDKCKIVAGVYAVGTNQSVSSDKRITITINDSDLSATNCSGTDKDNCTVMVNVAGAVLNINKSTITGDRQTVLVRDGTATITDSTIVFLNDSNAANIDTREAGTWSSGNEVISAAIVVGDMGTAYAGTASLTLKGVKINASAGTEAYKNVIVMARSTATDSAIKFTGDETVVKFGDAEIASFEEATFTAEKGAAGYMFQLTDVAMKVASKATVEESMEIASTITLTNSGTIVNNGIITNNGKIYVTTESPIVGKTGIIGSGKIINKSGAELNLVTIQADIVMQPCTNTIVTMKGGCVKDGNGFQMIAPNSTAAVYGIMFAATAKDLDHITCVFNGEDGITYTTATWPGWTYLVHSDASINTFKLVSKDVVSIKEGKKLNVSGDGADVTISTGAEVDVPSSSTLALGDQKVTNNGTIVMESGAVISGKVKDGSTGKIENESGSDVEQKEAGTTAKIEEAITGAATEGDDVIVSVTATSDGVEAVLTSNDVTLVGTGGVNLTNIDITVMGTETSSQALTISGFDSVSGVITTSDGTKEQSMTLSGFTGTIKVTKGSIYIEVDGSWTGMELENGAELHIKGTIGTAAITVVEDGSAKIFIDDDTSLSITTSLSIAKGIAVHVDGELTGAGTLMSNANIVVDDGAELTVGTVTDKIGAADAEKITITAMSGSVVSGIIDLKKVGATGSKLIAYSGSDINGIKAGTAFGQITGKDDASGEWTFTDGNTLNLNNYNGTYNFGGFATSITKIKVTGDNVIAYEFDSDFVEKNVTLFGKIDEAGGVTEITTATTGSLTINVDVSDIPEDNLFDTNTLVVIDGNVLSINGVGIMIHVTGANAEWTDANISAMNMVGIRADGAFVADYSSTVVAVMENYEAANVFGIKATSFSVDKAELLTVASAGTGLYATNKVTIQNCSVVTISGNDVGLMTTDDSVDTGIVEIKSDGLVGIKNANIAGKLKVMGSIIGFTDDAAIAGKIDVLNESVLGFEGTAVLGGDIEITQESTFAMKDGTIGKKLVNGGKVAFTGNVVVAKTGEIENNSVMTNSGLIGVYGKFTNNATFTNDGTLDIQMYGFAAGDKTLTIDDVAPTAAGNARIVSITLGAVESEANGCATVTATVTFRPTTGADFNKTFNGVLTPGLDGSYFLIINNETEDEDATATATLTYVIATPADVKIGGKQYTLNVTGYVKNGDDVWYLAVNSATAVVSGVDQIKYNGDDGKIVASTASITFGTKSDITNTGVFVVSSGAPDVKGKFTGALVTNTANTKISGKISGDITATGDGTFTVDEKATVEGNIVTGAAVDIKGGVFGSIETEKGLTATGAIIGNITAEDSVTVTNLIGNITVKANGPKNVTVKGAMAGTIVYVSKYLADKDDKDPTEYTAEMDVIGTANGDGFTIILAAGSNATASAAVVPGFFKIDNGMAELETGDVVNLTLMKGRFLVDSAITMKTGYYLTIEADTTIEVNKSAASLNVTTAALKVSKDANALFETGSGTPVEYGKVLYIMSFDISGGAYTIYSDVAYALTNCDEGSTLTVGASAPINTNVSVPAGVNIIVEDVTLTFNGMDVKMGEGAKFTIVGDGKLIFNTSDDNLPVEDDEEYEYYSVTACIVFGDNELDFVGVRFSADNNIIKGVAATESAEAKIDVDLTYNEGYAIVTAGYAIGDLKLENFEYKLAKDDEELTPVAATFTVSENAIFELENYADEMMVAVLDDDGDIIETSKPTMLYIDGTLKMCKSLTVKGIIIGDGITVLADDVTVTLAFGEYLDCEKDIYYGPVITTTMFDTHDNGFGLSAVYAKPHKAADVKPAAEGEKDGAIFTIKADKTNECFTFGGSMAFGIIDSVTADSAAMLDNVVIMDDAVFQAEDVTIKGDKNEANGLLKVVELTKKTGAAIKYSATYVEDEYTVYTIFKNIDLDEISDITLTEDLKVSDISDSGKVDLSGGDLNITIAEGKKLIVDKILIIGTPMTVLGDEGSSIVGTIEIKKGENAYLVAYADVDLSMAEVIDSDKKDAVFSKLDVEDVPYAVIFACEADKIVLAKADASLVPEITGYNFTAWLNYNGDAKAEVGDTNAYADAKAIYLTITVKYVAGVDYYMNGTLFNVYDIPTDVPYGSYFTAKISDTTKYQGNPLINGQKTVFVDDNMELVASGVTPIPEPTPEPAVGDSGLSLTDILLIVLVILIAIMVVILVLRLNRS
jgi:hypothetical protein